MKNVVVNRDLVNKKMNERKAKIEKENNGEKKFFKNKPNKFVKKDENKPEQVKKSDKKTEVNKTQFKDSGETYRPFEIFFKKQREEKKNK